METHKTVGMIIENEGNILLIKRLNAPNIGWWAVPGGHVEEGESFEEAVRREAGEEIPGVKITGRMELFFEWDVETGDSNDSSPHRHACQMFRGIPGKEITTGSDAGEYQWITPNDALKEKITPSSRYIIEWLARKKE